MKKLSGLFAFILCSILLSCSNFFSGKTGDISFSFSADEAIQAANSYAARSDDNDLYPDEYIFLVQIKGTEGFHDYQIKTIKVEDIGPVENEFAVSGQYLNNNNLEFLFDYVPFDQTYKVMLDMFVKKDSNMPYLVLSGKSNDIDVLPASQTEVVVNLEDFTLSPISLKIEYEDGNQTLGGLHSISSKNTNTNQTTISFFKEYGKLWGGDEDKSIKSIYYELDSNSNFPDSSFKFSLPCSYQSSTIPYDFVF